MMLGSKSRGGLFYSERIKVRTVCTASKPEGLKDGNEYCSHEIKPTSETVEGILLSVDPVRNWGRPCFAGRNG